MISRRFLLEGMAAASLMAMPRKDQAAENKTIDLYDSLLFVGKPDLSRHGLKRARTVYEHELGLPKPTPDEAAIRSQARAVLTERVTAVTLPLSFIQWRLESGDLYCPVGR
jgi:hypothetical protein